ncbi:MAG: hypothetical protein ABW049_13500 [Spongiibacteraceae bacterium]
MVVEGLPDIYRHGPRLSEANYPEVLVSRAVTDGAALELVLYPDEGNKRVSVGLDQLLPGKSYRAPGAVTQDLLADPFGRSTLIVDLQGRQEVRIVPA